MQHHEGDREYTGDVQDVGGEGGGGEGAVGGGGEWQAGELAAGEGEDVGESAGAHQGV